MVLTADTVRRFAAYGDAVLHDSDNVWTGWVIQIGAMVAAIKFSAWYPDRVRADIADEVQRDETR